MPKINLRDARRIKSAAGEGRALKLPGGHVWRRRVIGDLYGTGPGQIALHLTPRDAVLSGGNVTSIPNRGGAGAALAGAAPSGITRPAQRLVVAGNTGWLDLAGPVELMGTRTFMVLKRTDNTNRRFASMEASGAQDWEVNTDRMMLFYGGYTMPDGSAASRFIVRSLTSGPSLGPIPFVTELALYEVQLSGGVAAVFMNGVQYGSGTLPAGLTSYQIIRLFAGQVSSASNWPGEVGDIVTFVTDGTHTQQIDTIRRELADLHGIALGQVLGGASGK